MTVVYLLAVFYAGIMTGWGMKQGWDDDRLGGACRNGLVFLVFCWLIPFMRLWAAYRERRDSPADA